MCTSMYKCVGTGIFPHHLPNKIVLNRPATKKMQLPLEKPKKVLLLMVGPGQLLGAFFTPSLTYTSMYVHNLLVCRGIFVFC